VRACELKEAAAVDGEKDRKTRVFTAVQLSLHAGIERKAAILGYVGSLGSANCCRWSFPETGHLTDRSAS
jgi:hypothetical protein